MVTSTLVLVLALSVLVGLTLGILGGGGAILMVPILTYVAGFDARHAIASSLFVVGVTSAVSAVTHARAGRVQWRTGLIFGAAGMAGAFAGGLIGGLIPGKILLIGFAVVMLAASVGMIRGRRGATAPPQPTSLPVARVLLYGSAVGLVSGLVGAGGGFLVVPALALLGALPMAIAVGTSVLVVAMQTLAGLTGYLTTISLDWGVVLGITAAAIGGTLVGSRLGGRLPDAALRKGFGWFVLAMGVLVLLEQAPADLRLPGLGAAIIVAATIILYRLLARPSRSDESPSP